MRGPAPPALLLLAAAALLPLPARAGERDAKAEKAAEKAFLEAFQAAGPDERARAKAVETLRDAPDGLKSSLLLEKVLPKEDAPCVLQAAVAVLRRVKEDDAVKALAVEAQGKGNWSVRCSAIEALGGIDSPAAVEGLVKALKDADPRGASNILFALAERHPPAALEAVKKQVGHSAWQVRIGTLSYLERLKDPKTVPLLVERLEEEAGRLKHEVVEALKAVTGKDYKGDVAKWRAYAEGGEAAAAAAGAPAGGDPAAGGGGRAVATGAAPIEPTYYGQKVYSDRVVFVIDLSLSMNAEMVVDRETIVRETGAVTSGTGEEGRKPSPEEKADGEIMPIEWWKIRTRVDFAKSQLKYAVSTLKRGQAFDIVWFSDSVKPWQGRLVGATPGVKVKAAEWIDALKCEGGTNSWGGLTKALNLVGRGGEDENYTHGADTLYFLSDGEPSCGEIKDKDQILDAIGRIHKVRRVKIHVVQIGTSPLPFMRTLAAITGGDYKFFNAKGPDGK